MKIKQAIKFYKGYWIEQTKDDNYCATLKLTNGEYIRVHGFKSVGETEKYIVTILRNKL